MESLFIQLWRINVFKDFFTFKDPYDWFCGPHMILLSIQYAGLLLKKHFLLLSMLKTVVLNIFVETMMHFSGFFD